MNTISKTFCLHKDTLTTPRRPPRTPTWEAVRPASQTGLAADSLLLPQQIRTISQARVVRPAGKISDPELRLAVAARIRLHMGLDGGERED